MVEKKKKTRSTSSSVDPATQYAMDVTSGAVLAGPDIRAACARHIRDLEEGPKRGLFWDVEAVMVANSDVFNPIPDAATLAAVQAYIEPRAPVAGADIYVFAPAPHVINFQIRLNPDNPEVRFAVEAELRSMMLRDGTPGGLIKPSRISEAISIATGEYSHTLVSPSSDIEILKGEVGIVGTISWT